MVILYIRLVQANDPVNKFEITQGSYWTKRKMFKASRTRKQRWISVNHSERDFLVMIWFGTSGMLFRSFSLKKDAEPQKQVDVQMDDSQDTQVSYFFFAPC